MMRPLHRQLFRCVALTAFLLGGNARGDEPGSAGAGLIAELRAKGLERIGDFDLREFQKQQRELRWKIKESPEECARFATGRRTACYRRDLQAVFISPEIPASAQEALPTLENHESLGAAGYNDRNYAMSSALSTLNQMRSEKDREKLAEDLGTTIFDKDEMFSSGTGTSVGGGGDLIALVTKTRVLEEFMKRQKDLSWDFLRRFPEIGFEPLYLRSQQFVALRYQARPAAPERFGLQALPGVRVDRRHGTQELISVYVPALLWQKGPEQRRAIVEEIIGYLADLFPVTDRELLRPIEGLGCIGGQNLEFPRARSAHTALVQRSRAALLTGCDPSSVIHDIKIPSFEAPEDESAKTNPSAFKCRLKAGNHVLTRTDFEPRKGKASRAVLASGSAPGADGILGSMLIGIVETNARGEVARLRLTNSDPATGRKKESVVEVKPGEVPKIEGKTLWGHAVALICERH